MTRDNRPGAVEAAYMAASEQHPAVKGPPDVGAAGFVMREPRFARKRHRINKPNIGDLISMCVYLVCSINWGKSWSNSISLSISHN